MEKLKDKVIVITGASGGIGFDVSKRLISLGAKLVLLGGKNLKRLNELKSLASSLPQCSVISALPCRLKNAILIPEYEIAGRAEKELPDKDALILVYCRSGRRSKIASEELVKLGYTNVKEFGGIIDWPYEIVK